MTKEQAILIFGGGSQGIATLAKALNITRHAIYQWNDPIPELRELQIARLCVRSRRGSDKKKNAVYLAPVAN